MSNILADILKGTIEVNNKIQKIQARNDLLESHLRNQKISEQQNENKSSESDDENEQQNLLTNMGTRTAMEIATDLIKDCNLYFNKDKKSRSLGFNMSFAQFQSL